MPTGKLEWGRILGKLSPYTIQKGFRYLKHYGPKEFWVRLHERFEPEEVPYGPWYESYRPDIEELEKQKKRKWKYQPKISVVVPAYQTPEYHAANKELKRLHFDTNLGFTSHFKQNLIIFYTINK